MKNLLTIWALLLLPFLLAGQYLPDIQAIYPDIQKMTKEDQFEALGQRLQKENRDFKAPYIYHEEAKAWASADQPDKAARALLLAFQHGMTDPKILDNRSALAASVKESKKWPVIQKKLKQLRNRMVNPENLEVSYQEAVDFLNALRKAKADTANARQYFEEMILNGSPAMKEYYIIRYGNVDNIVKTTMERYPGYYEYLLSTLKPETLTSIREQTMQNMLRFYELYPDANFPKGYLLIGMLNSGGTLTNLGVYIGLDMYARSDDMPEEELNDWHKSVIKRADGISNTLTHELMHFQQNYRDTLSSSNVLRKVISEGVCDFLVGLSKAFKGFTPINDDYFLENEAKVVSWLKEDLHKEDLSRWMYNGNNAKDYPADLGYTLGYFICKSYYEQAEDKQQAIKELLTTDSFFSILEGSKYAYVLK